MLSLYIVSQFSVPVDKITPSVMFNHMGCGRGPVLLIRFSYCIGDRVEIRAFCASFHPSIRQHDHNLTDALTFKKRSLQHTRGWACHTFIA